MNVSITIPIYNPNKEILKRVINSVKNQKYKGKFELICVDKKGGFSEQMNYGIKKSKYPIVVMLPQDCIPSSKYWLARLVEPFKDKKVIAAVSKITLPEEIWNSLSLFAKALMIKEKGTNVSLLDGKGGAYRKSLMKKVGLFDEKTFKTAGEDFDIYMKLKDFGSVAYPNAEIIHMHPTNFVARLRKNYQYANGYGAIVRIYRSKMYRWYVGFFHAFPGIGIFSQILGYPFKKGLSFFPFYIIASIANHPYYILGFWKGFFEGKQTV
ncbi:MAG: glycosyltransferase family 2 protein [Nanoarchaeota archaeon]